MRLTYLHFLKILLLIPLLQVKPHTKYLIMVKKTSSKKQVKLLLFSYCMHAMNHNIHILTRTLIRN